MSCKPAFNCPAKFFGPSSPPKKLRVRKYLRTPVNGDSWVNTCTGKTYIYKFCKWHKVSRKKCNICPTGPTGPGGIVGIESVDTCATSETTTVPFGQTFPSPPLVTYSLQNTVGLENLNNTYLGTIGTSDFDVVVNFNADPPPNIVIPDGTGAVGEHTSLAVVNGNPAISYIFFDTNLPPAYSLKYVRSNDSSGLIWGTPISVFNAGTQELTFTSLSIISGNPAISYILDNNVLQYSRGTDANGTSWATKLNIDGAVSFTSLLQVNGNPAISYYNGGLKFARSVDNIGLGAWNTYSVDAIGDVGQYNSLAIVNGRPAISYYDATNFSLKYVRASDADGTIWDPPITVILGTVSMYVGICTSLEIVNGRPAISCYLIDLINAVNYQLLFVRANDIDGSSWPAPITVDIVNTGLVSNQRTSLKIVCDKPAISYSVFSDNNFLKYAFADDSDGTTWSNFLTVDSVGDVGYYNSLSPVVGGAGISYYDATSEDLKYAFINNNKIYNIIWHAQSL